MDEVRVDGKIAVVTGAGRGLGREHALLLGQRGATVVVNDVGPGDDPADPRSAAEITAAEIVARGGSASANTTAVGTLEAGRELVGQVLEQYGRIDILVNNAGILRDRTFAKMSVEEFDAVLRVHLGGTVWTTYAAWPHLIEQRGGSVVNTTSAAGLFGNFGQVNYSAAKAAIVGATKAMALEGARAGIRVNAIEPGARTRMTEGLLGELAGSLDPSLVSPVVLWLACDECTVSGEVYNAGGGRVARVLVAQTEGFHSPTLSAEDIRASWDSINDLATTSNYLDFRQELDTLMDLIKSS